MSYYITKTTVKAPIAHITDGADEVPIKSWEVEIAPTLTGKSAIECTQTGRNLCPNSFEQGTFSESSPVGSNYATMKYVNTIRGRSTDIFRIDNGNVNVSCADGYQLFITLFGSDGKYLGQYVGWTTDTAITNSSVYYIAVAFKRNDNGTITDADFEAVHVMCEVGSSASSYSPYIAPTVNTVNLGRTIYGGTADVANGNGKDNGKKIKLNTLSWSYDDTSYSYGIFLIPSNISDMTGNLKFVCINYVNNGHPRNQLLDGEIGVFNLSNSNKRLVIRDDSCTTLEQFLAKIADYDFVYETTTDTPFTFTPITPTPETALGVNNFWADSGDTEVTYYCLVESEELYTVTDTTLKNIADAIRTKTERTAPILVEDMDDEILSIVTGGGGDAQCDRLFYAQGYDNWQVEIPTIASLIQDEKYSEYVSYDTTTKKFTALKDFTAVIVAWVYTYQTYEASRSDGAFYVNSTKLAQYEANGNAAGSVGGVRLIYNLKQGDTFYPYTPTTDGYPRQYCKVYAISDIDDDVFTYANEEAT